jgi:hypothetical protein
VVAAACFTSFVKAEMPINLGVPRPFGSNLPAWVNGPWRIGDRIAQIRREQRELRASHRNGDDGSNSSFHAKVFRTNAALATNQRPRLQSLMSPFCDQPPSWLSALNHAPNWQRVDPSENCALARRQFRRATASPARFPFALTTKQRARRSPRLGTNNTE